LADVGERFVALARSGGLDLELPGKGVTLRRWAALAALGREDPVLARLGEGHADALAILAELGGSSEADAVWGVWAAVPDAVRAERDGRDWRVTGRRPWCSGAAVCTRALVTARADDGPRLFAVPVEHPSVGIVDGTWPAVGMARSDSRTVEFSGTPADPVGGVDEYVNRPGFWHGSMGVAACWWGAAVGVADVLRDAARRKDLDPHARAHLGAVDAALAAGRGVLRDAAAAVDDRPDRPLPMLARQVRAVVEAAATDTIDRVGRALGAGPLCLDAAHATRVADLTVYLRQSHAERDLEALGELVTSEAPESWGTLW
jgi:alkylation response protein AidB-like acyl-CoA dehydrogenase